METRTVQLSFRTTVLVRVEEIYRISENPFATYNKLIKHGKRIEELFEHIMCEKDKELLQEEWNNTVYFLEKTKEELKKTGAQN